MAYFGENNKNYLRKLKDEPDATDKRKAEILEEELIDIRKQIKPVEIKRAGAKFNEADWFNKRDAIMQSYIQQRYDTDNEFKRIMDAVKEKNGILMFYNGNKKNDLGGILKGDNMIEGQNKLGIMYMRTIGLTP